MTWVEVLGIVALTVLMIGGLVVIVVLLIGSGANPE